MRHVRETAYIIHVAEQYILITYENSKTNRVQEEKSVPSLTADATVLSQDVKWKLLIHFPKTVFYVFLNPITSNDALSNLIDTIKINSRKLAIVCF